MRLVGALLILGGCTGLGLWYKEQLLGRLRTLRKLAAILEMLMSEIRYGKATLSECCREVAVRVEEPYKSVLMKVYQECNNATGIPFGEVFVGQMDKMFIQLPVKKEDKEVFLSPFRNQGFQDGQMQIKSLEQSLYRLNDMIRIQNEEQQEKCRMSVGLGVMSGLLLVIVMM